MLFDTHAHIYSEYYDDIEEVIINSQKMGVNYIISDGVDYNTNRELLSLAKKYNNLYITIGFHPENTDDYDDKSISFLEDNIQEEKVIAIGEIGLDYHYENYNKEKQIKMLEEQLSLAEKYKLPVVIHSREATLDTLTILKKYNVKGVIHCFSGSYETAVQYIKMGYKLGVNGVVTFKNANIKEVIKKVGVENIVLETDSPYLSPEPVRGTKNIPGNTMYVAEFLANYLNIDINELIDVVNKNTYAIFDKIKSE